MSEEGDKEAGSLGTKPGMVIRLVAFPLPTSRQNYYRIP
jgi:hypothetical protein